MRLEALLPPLQELDSAMKIFALLATVATVNALVTCDNVTVDDVVSYHVHILFLKNNEGSVNASTALGAAFEERFSSLGASNECPFGHTNPNGDNYKNMTEMCKFSRINDGDGEYVFNAANFAFFVPPQFLGEATAFSMWAQHDYVRDYSTIFIHQNSGCQDRDHLYSPLRGVQIRDTSSVPTEVDGPHLCCKTGVEGTQQAGVCGTTDYPGDCPP